MSKFLPNKVYLRGILLHYFIQKKSAAEAHRILVETYGDNALSDTTCRDWFRRFKNNDFELEDKERSGAPKKFQDKELEQLLDEKALVLPEGFRERERLKQEANFYGLPGLEKAILENTDSGGQIGSAISKRVPGYITIGYRGSFAFGREGLADVKFRKLSRILVCGRVALCRDVFGETLNESRDPDHGMSDRYTSRFFLKHSVIEQAFDMLQEQGFRLAGSCGSGTAGSNSEQLKPGVDSEENRWNHYNEFVFVRD
ncbi:KCD16 protein, partial [Pseudoatta argentina]